MTFDPLVRAPDCKCSLGGDGSRLEESASAWMRRMRSRQLQVPITDHRRISSISEPAPRESPNPFSVPHEPTADDESTPETDGDDVRPPADALETGISPELARRRRVHPRLRWPRLAKSIDTGTPSSSSQTGIIVEERETHAEDPEAGDGFDWASGDGNAAPPCIIGPDSVFYPGECVVVDPRLFRYPVRNTPRDDTFQLFLPQISEKRSRGASREHSKRSQSARRHGTVERCPGVILPRVPVHDDRSTSLDLERLLRRRRA